MLIFNYKKLDRLEVFEQPSLLWLERNTLRIRDGQTLFRFPRFSVYAYRFALR